MTGGRWEDALLAASLFAIDPGTGGISVRALPGPVRERFLTHLRAVLPEDAPVRRLPLHIADDRLLGGLDLPATLQAGRPVAARGLLAEADGGVVLLAMAERVSAATAARLSHTLDSGEVLAERDGLALRSQAAIGVVALDEGQPDEQPPAALLDRLAFLVDLSDISIGEAASKAPDTVDLPAARTLLPSVSIEEEVLEALCGTAQSLGVASLRALLLAVRAARATAALAGRTVVTRDDAIVAARLVLGPRATTLPPAAEQQQTEQPAADNTPPAEPQSGGADDQIESESAPRDDRSMGDIMLAACQAAMPAGLLAQLLAGKAERRPVSGGGAGVSAQSKRRGRPIGVRAGPLRDGARLNLIETLRAAAPWQTLRKRGLPPGAPQRVIVMPDDFRITRFRQRTETTTIFLVDASGSAAISRLAEAKGAVELVLAECYVRRDRVALIAFRGSQADLLLPPTNSLVRAKRSLAGLPGGGGTPLAAGIDAAVALADEVRRRGQTPAIILLSDGRANIARNGTPGRAAAEADAHAASRRLRATAVPTLVVDTSPRPAAEAKRLATEMGARYLPLPYADAEALSRAVRARPRA